MDHGSKRKSYDFNFKSEVIKFAEENRNNTLLIDAKLRQRRCANGEKEEGKIVDVVSEKRKKNDDNRLPGGGRPAINNEMN